MQCSFDWLAFTIWFYQGQKATVKSVVEDVLGMDYNLFQDMDKGGLGYKNQFFYNDIRIYYNGNEGMGIHVVLSSSGVRLLENREGFEWRGFLYMLINWYEVKISRVDVAVDDYKGILDMELIERKMKSGEIVSVWKKGRPVSEFILVDGKEGPKTLYFGSRESDVFCRYYNKHDEQEAKGRQLESDIWVRCELEIKHQKAIEFIDQYVRNGMEIGLMFSQLINRYMRIVSKGNDTNRARWGTIQMWYDFVSTVEKLKLSIKQPEKTLDDVYNWIMRSVSPSLNLVFQAAGNDFGVIIEILKDGAGKLSSKHLQLLTVEQNKERGNYTIDSHWREYNKKILENEQSIYEERKCQVRRLLGAIGQIIKSKVCYEQVCI